MKKTYINPEMVIIKVQTQQMLAGSIQATLGGTQGNSEALGHGDDADWGDDEY